MRENFPPNFRPLLSIFTMPATFDDLKERVGTSTLDRIGKLLARSKDKAATEAEASTAMNFALDILAKHNLSIQDVDGINFHEESVESERIERGKRNDSWRSELLYAIADTHFCHMYRNHGGGYTITGTPTNREACNLLFSYLESTIEQNALQAVSEYKGWENKRSYANSFRLGMVSRIVARLYAQKRDIIQEAKGVGTDIVVKNPYEVAAKKNLEHIASNGIKLRSSSSVKRINSGAGYLKGRDAGNRVGLTAGHCLGR